MIHIIAEFILDSPRKLENIGSLKPTLDKIVKKTGLHVLSSAHHQFEPSGATIIYLLSESHLSVHTWPEFSYVHVDFFSCSSDTKKALDAIEKLEKELGARKASKRVMGTDLYEKARSSCRASQ